MKALLVCLVLACLPAILAQDGINTGEGLYSLLFPVNGGGIELATTGATKTLGQYLPASFSFEAWIMLPQTARDGHYKVITSRWQIGPDSTYHNRWADFVFQVQAAGTLNIFMGNGAPGIYGINMGTVNLLPKVWYHAAFTINCCQSGTLNPNSVSVFLDGTEFTQSWAIGARQLPNGAARRNVYLGDYFNQDGDHQWWRGYMDEVRYWSGVRGAAQFLQYRQRVPPLNTPGLLAYYRFNDAAGLMLGDLSPNKFDGRLSKPTVYSSSPLWRVSGAKIHVDVKVAPLSLVTIKLPGLAPGGPNSFTYVLESLSKIDQNAPLTEGRLVAEGKYVRQTPYALRQAQVGYQSGNATGAVVTFSYYGTYDFQNPKSREPLSTIVYITVGSYTCNPDACGVCNGDNSTCSCLPIPYQGYTLNDVERVLALYEIEQTLDALNTLDSKVDRAQKAVSQHDASELQSLLTSFDNFLGNCVTSFCQKIAKHVEGLSSLQLAA